jgi:predicted lysophospholipase L1 biosynthesis ABC-type transport system permease subunit
LKKLLTYTSVLLGGLITLVGASFVVMYFWEAIIKRTGEPDQSLIFWYLPILFLGLIGVLGGLALLIQGINRIRNLR